MAPADYTLFVAAMMLAQNTAMKGHLEIQETGEKT